MPTKDWEISVLKCNFNLAISNCNSLDNALFYRYKTTYQGNKRGYLFV